MSLLVINDNPNFDCRFNRCSAACAALVLAAFSGCQDTQMARLNGTWQLDQPQRIEARISSTDASPTERDSSHDSNQPSRMTLTFYGNGRLKTETAMGSVQGQKNGTWRVISFDEATGNMTIRCKIGLQETDHPVQFEDAETILIQPPNMAGLSMKMRFRRVH